MAAVIETLKGKHGKTFTLEQYNAWAQLVNMGKHMSTDEPPQYPFFVGRSKTKVADSTAKANPSKGSFSPGKRIQLRTELLDQMQKLSSLLERGDISQDQYDAMKVMVMNDISETKLMNDKFFFHVINFSVNYNHNHLSKNYNVQLLLT